MESVQSPPVTPDERSPAPKKRARAPWVTSADLAEGGLLADVGVILYLAVNYIPGLQFMPFLGNFVEAAVPVPFVILLLRRGWRATLLSSLVAGFLTTVLAGPHFGWRMAVDALVGLLIGVAIRMRAPAWVSVTLGTVFLSLIGLAAFLALVFFLGQPITNITGFLRNALDSLAALLEWLAQFAAHGELWRQALPTYIALAQLSIVYWPALLFIYIFLSTLPFMAVSYLLIASTAHVLDLDMPSRRRGARSTSTPTEVPAEGAGVA